MDKALLSQSLQFSEWPQLASKKKKNEQEKYDTDIRATQRNTRRWAESDFVANLNWVILKSLVKKKEERGDKMGAK